jgi:citrate lyase subunit beta/citryl-CoA lyase
MNDYFRPRRSMLYIPGCNQHYLEKALTMNVDSVILDLGAPILLSAKEASRENVVAALKKGGLAPREVVVRVNDLDSKWGYDDVNAIANLGADAILFSNIENHDDVMKALKALDDAGNSDIPIMVMIESPLAVLHAEEIAKSSDRIACMIMATSDLISDLHARPTYERTAILKICKRLNTHVVLAEIWALMGNHSFILSNYLMQMKHTHRNQQKLNLLKKLLRH